MKKKAIIKLIKSVAKLLVRVFYDVEINKCDSKWFTKYNIGYLWALRSIPHRIKRRDIRVPYGKDAIIISGKNLQIEPSSINCLQADIYLQNRLNTVVIGKDCYIAQHVGIITEQHNVYNLDNHNKGEDVTIGNSCWIGMNAVIMPGVILGDHTVVGANSVVTHSFSEGYCVIAGAPAKLIRKIEKHHNRV